MPASPEPMGTVDVALAHAARLLETHPDLALEQTDEILRVAPSHAVATLLRGLALGRNGHGQDAATALRESVTIDPNLVDGWRALGDQLLANGDATGANAAYAQHIKVATRDPRLLEPAAALCENRIAVAETLLRTHLKSFPTDVPAIRMLAEVAARLGRYDDAEKLLDRCLELAPSFEAARHNYAIVLHRQHRWGEALREVEMLLSVDPANPGYRNLRAAIFARIGEGKQALEAYESVLAEFPRQPKVWMSYGHTLRTAGRREDCLKAYRRSIELSPKLGEAYWSLANLKTVKFSENDLDAMRGQLERKDLTVEERFHFHFALGKALEDAGEYARSFEHYAEGNSLRRSVITYDAADLSSHVSRCKALFTRSFFDERAGQGSEAPDPIFIVGLPRAGSTLLEQILSSHSQIEGTQELPELITLARRLGERRSRAQESKYPGVLATLEPQELKALGEQYLERTRIYRKTRAPFFIDKMPNNFMHVGLIRLALPNAKIIDARRHPLACCFSGYKQHFARGQHFTYSLEDIGRYYRDYVELMAHFDQTLPAGTLHRVIYEDLVDDTEAQLRQLLDFLGLPFEERCLSFHATERAVRTASSEQVRKPIYRDGVDHWRHYEPWLDPLKRALGPALEAWPRAAA